MEFRFSEVVEMSWKRHVKAQVSKKEGEEDQVGKCWVMMAWPEKW